MLPIVSSLMNPCSSLVPQRVLPAVKAASKAASVACLLAIALPASSQRPIKPPTQHPLTIPESSRTNPEDAGVRMHTNVRYRAGYTPDELPPFSGYDFDTPASLACIYGLASYTQGCNPNVTTQDATGGSQTIAIVDAFDYPQAAADLAFFSQQFGLPFNPSKFHVVYAQGAQPPEDPTGGWEFEESIDTQYSHAMAPNATIYLVEANSNSGSDLYPAILIASNLVACGHTTTCPAGSKGQGQVSISWGGSEFSEEAQLDSFFTTPNVVYVASSGDAPGVSYPCASPNVLCAGGTTDSRSLETGNLIAQIGWSDAGGGLSAYEPIPKYQAQNPFIAHQLQGARGVPDVSAIANPDTGVWVWSTFPIGGTGWFSAGGTSVAAPVLAGILNSTGNFAVSTSAELTKLYGNSLLFLDGGFTDITYGACNVYASSFAQVGWDQCTGLGTPNHLK
jgi:kumamolisin